MQRVSTAFNALGYTTWWDDRLVPTERWEPTIYQELRNARIVFVLWTSKSLSSTWVREEATRAAHSKKLFSVRFEDCEIPGDFQSFQYYSLLDWKPGLPHTEWERIQIVLAERLAVKPSWLNRWRSSRAKIASLRHWKTGILKGEELTGSPPTGTVFQDCEWAPPMTVAPVGSFWMGSPTTEEGRYLDTREDPRHEIQIARPFAASQCAVTIADFRRFVSGTGHRCIGKVVYWDGTRWNEASDRQYDAPGWKVNESHPATLVSWYDAKFYCDWLTAETGLTYRLLSEAEWEFICRGGTQTPFYFGTRITTSQANFNGDPVYTSGGTFGGSKPGLNREMTVPVREFGQNEWGFFQLHGNVWEWVEDQYGPYADCPTDAKPAAHVKATCRCQRGGSWSDPPRHLRSAVRGWQYPELRSNSVGFRIARDL